MTLERIHLTGKQKRLLAERARLYGTSLSEQVSAACDLYLAMSVEVEDDLKHIARAANRSADRTIRKLDHTIAYVSRRLKKPQD